MNSIAGIISRLQRGAGVDRRLDAEIIATVQGPPGSTVDPVEGLDGFDVLLSEGSNICWREACDIPGLTSSFADAFEFISEVKPEQSMMIVRQAFQTLKLDGSNGMDVLRGQAARALMVELLRSLAHLTVQGVGQAA